MSNADLARLGRKLAHLRRQIQRILDRLLGVGSYEFVSHVPPHDTSPRGLLRMASPEIPRGPQPGLHIDAPVHPGRLLPDLRNRRLLRLFIDMEFQCSS
ncbi:hypothetical protein ABTX82_37810 [Streptomyces lavendulae]|uniref:hypothetical protein n=1 Tax=Streptomyces lavendulae TaxID=1914 RepID=UPI0033234496